ncbi:polysaccharide lyase 6 family protein [Sphingobacterium paucimobilis]|uniref:Poly(Beta-D-mannuronate) lyase n=1 Tax=Sphingobacterium paucimobilis HER1398 TaxID=1346330 RepID=U2HB23_9SPHI|nr:polysaccharide lyase 6 family protein [Sphingobacterium paucimobilis]ERJ58946.1 hypothetical protein M472_09195 [Sphingobacterium paucimobilis HER1398]
MKYLLTSLLISFFTCSILAKEYHIHSAEELTALSLHAGDRVVMIGKKWTDQKIIFKGEGTESSPILLTAAHPGQLSLGGSSNLIIDGKWLIVDGLSFHGGYTLKEHVISFTERSENCRLTNTAIVDYDNPDKSMRNSWIVLYGFQNRVDHCFIAGKTHLGTTIGIYVSDKPNYHRIDHNYFAGRPPLGRNGGEIIRMGTDQWSMHDSFTTVEDNVFVHCDGEIEIISNKSTNNTIRNNLFYESKGMLTLRHGNKANVYGNYFIGNQKPGTGGIRIIGEEHRIHNNYFQGLTGTGLNATITFMNAWENPPLHGYWQVKNTEVRHNTIIDCTEPIVVGSGKNEQTFLPPIHNIIANNMIIAKTAQVITWLETRAKNPDNIRFEKNIVSLPPHIAADSYPPGVHVQDPLLRLNNWGLLQHSKKTPKDIGNTPLSSTQEALFKTDGIGPSWKRPGIKLTVQ